MKSDSYLTNVPDDECYVIDLCDEVLKVRASRQHRFDFLRGDGIRGRALPVDAYYAELNLVVEYRERQHVEAVPFWDNKPTASGKPRGEQRAAYDAKRREILPKHGIALVELTYTDFRCAPNKRLKRDRVTDEAVIRQRLERWLAANR